MNEENKIKGCIKRGYLCAQSEHIVWKYAHLFVVIVSKRTAVVMDFIIS